MTAVIVAAGSGTRMCAGINKVFLKIGNYSVIDYTVSVFASCDEIDNIILVTRECDIKECKKHIKYTDKPVKVIKGGETRQESVYCGLKEVDENDLVIIHDGARALIVPEIIKNTLEEAKKYRAAATGVKAKDTIKISDKEGFIEKTLDRNYTYQIQTPQIFYRDDILKAHEAAVRDGFTATDDCALYEKYIGKVKITEGSYDNIKLTTPSDMTIAKNILKNSPIIKIVNMRRTVKTAAKIIVSENIIKMFIKKNKDKTHGRKI